MQEINKNFFSSGGKAKKFLSANRLLIKNIITPINERQKSNSNASISFRSLAPIECIEKQITEINKNV